MDGRVSPQEIMANAKTPDGIAKMKEEIRKAEADVRKQYRKAILQYHPDKNVGRDTTEASKVVLDLYEKSNAEFASARKWLDRQEQELARAKA